MYVHINVIKVYSTSSSSNSISVQYIVVGLLLLSVIYLQFESHLNSGKETVTHT